MESYAKILWVLMDYLITENVIQVLMSRCNKIIEHKNYQTECKRK